MVERQAELQLEVLIHKLPNVSRIVCCALRGREEAMKQGQGRETENITLPSVVSIPAMAGSGQG